MSIFHWHDWQLVKAQPGLYRHGWETELLYVCLKCSRPKTERLRGKWTLRDIDIEATQESPVLREALQKIADGWHFKTTTEITSAGIRAKQIARAALSASVTADARATLPEVVGVVRPESAK